MKTNTTPSANKNTKTENEFLKRENEETNHCNLLTTAYLVQHVILESYQFEVTQIFQRSSCPFVVRLSPDPFLEQFCLLVRLLTSLKASFKMRAFTSEYKKTSTLEQETSPEFHNLVFA